MEIQFWGTRGSIATPGPKTNVFGGNTSCVELVTDAYQHVVFDAGTGARLLGANLMATASRPITVLLLLSHSHWDHIQGFPFFAPAFIPESKLTVCAPEGSGRSLPDVLAGQMEYTYFPVELGQLAAQISYFDLKEGLYELEGLRVRTQYLNHPAVTLGYRVDADEVSVVYACDHEPFSTTLWNTGTTQGSIEDIVHENDRRHALFMLDADLVIHDAQYTPSEYPQKRNWGHSTYEYVVRLAMAARVRKLFLTHHDPGHDDAFLTDVENRARAMVRNAGSAMEVACAREGYCEKIIPRLAGERRASVSHSDKTLPIDACGPQVESQRLRVLVVDDDADMRILASRVLTKAGYVVSEASGGLEALALLDKDAPDLMLLDISMPDLSGIEVLQILRSKVEFSALPVIVLTAYGDEDITRESFAAGATDFVSKPFSPPQLSARVRACFARAATRDTDLQPLQ